MRWSYALALLLAAALVGCDSGRKVEAAGRGCTTIVSAVERLACFDAAAGTPPTPARPVTAPASAPTSAPASAPASAPVVEPPAIPSELDIAALVRSSEARRKPEQTATLLLRAEDAVPGQSRVVISAPALGGREPWPYLAISCLQNISRLQLLTAQPLAVDRVSIQLLLDGRPISDSRPWQVLEDGSVTDAGRGLVAIEQLRQLTRPAQRLQVVGDHAPFEGLVFDATALHEQMVQQREACHW